MAGRAFVSLYTKNDALTRGLQKAKADLNKFGADMMAIGTKMVAMSAVIATPIVFATAKFAEFDDAMRAVGAVSQSTAAELASMTAVAKELGRTTSFTAVQVAQMMTELGRAGFKPDQVNEMTGAVLNLSRATGTDATLASGIMAASIRQFSLDAGDAARVADVLTMGANATFNSVESLGEALKYAGPVAAELGMSLEDTVAILGTLGNVGIQGSEAGTALRRLGVISAATGEKLKATFDISNIDAAGNLKPLVQIMDEIGQAVNDLPVAEKVAKMNEAFGLLGITASSVLSRTAGSTMDLAEALKNAEGTAAKTAATMDAGLGGSFRIIMSAAEGLQIAIGEALAGSIKTVTETVTGFIGRATEWVTKNQDLVTTITAVTIAVAGFGAAMIAVGVSAKIAAVGFAGVAVGVGIIKSAFGIASGVVRLFQAATVGLATVMSTAFAGSAIASAAAVTSLVAAESSSIIIMAPYAAATVVVANAVGLLGMNTAATAVAMIGQANAMGLITVASSVASAGLLSLAGSESLASAGGMTLMATAAGASTGMLTMSGSAVVASVGVGTVAASAGIMATAWTAAAGVIAAAWGVIMGPMAPFILLAGVVVAGVAAISVAAAYATLKGTDFSGAWGLVTKTLSELMEVAKRVGGILMDALGGGDYDIAMGVVFQGLKIILANAIDGMTQLWDMFWRGAWEMTKKFFAKFLGITARIMLAVADSITSPLQTAKKLGDAVKSLATTGFDISIGIDTDGMREKANAEIDKLEAELARRKSGRDAEAKSKADAEAKKTADEATGKPPGGGDGTPSGAASAEQIDADQVAGAEAQAAAFDRETESLQQQIIALRDGADAAERFRLAKQGLTDEQINSIMILRQEEEAITKQQAASGRVVNMIQDMADADYEKNKLSPAEIAKKEKQSIEAERRLGKIDDKTAAEAVLEADIRQAEKEHQERLKVFKGEGPDGKIKKVADGIKGGGASSATFSAASLLSMGSGAGQNSQLAALIDTKKAISLAAKQAQEKADEQIAAIKNNGLHHA